MKDIFKKSFHITKGTLLRVFCFMLVVEANAQSLESIVNAEKAFAQTSVDQNTRAAFLEFFSDSTIAFGGGQPKFGRAEWEKREANNGYLFWWPVYADVATSGDFGYTTGPAVFGPDKSTKEVKGGIYYASVWKKNAADQWKVLADMGSATYDPKENLTSLKTYSKSLPTKVKKGTGVYVLDKEYNNKLNSKHSSFDVSYFSTEGRIHRRGISPVISKGSIEKLTESQHYQFEYVGGEVASSNDMAFTYGKVKVDSGSACYMRVWKNEGGTWRIVLDVIGG